LISHTPATHLEKENEQNENSVGAKARREVLVLNNTLERSGMAQAAQGQGNTADGKLPYAVVMPSAIAVQMSDKALKTSAGNSTPEDSNPHPHRSPGSYTGDSNNNRLMETQASSNQGQAPPHAVSRNKKGTFHPDNILACMCPGKLKELPPCRLCIGCCLGCYILLYGPSNSDGC
jgi:hypothetical protein